MELPEDMPKGMKKMLALAMGIEPDYSTWVQVGKLSDGEKMAHKTFCRVVDKISLKDALLKAQHDKLDAERAVLHRGFWNRLYEAHSLPSGNDYHITREGLILMEPKGEKE